MDAILPFGRRAPWAIAGSLALLAACSDSNDSVASVTPLPQPATHPEVILRDVQGEALPVDSTEPYSPRMTCGRCHDVDTIANAYHFQQGRIDAVGVIEPRLQQPWQPDVSVLSPGMFGKW
jgi:hypothetical protein